MSEINIRTFRPGDEEYVATAHVRIYVGEFGFNPKFSEYVVKIARGFAAAPKKEREELWIAEDDGKPVGCILLLETEDPAIGQIRQFLVEKEYRGRGIGGMLTDAVMAKAKECRYQKLILQTGDLQEIARAHYAHMGFHMVKKWPNEWTTDGKVHYDEEWEMSL